MKTIPLRYHLMLTTAAALGFAAITLNAVLAQAQVPPEMQAEARSLAQACRADFTRLCPSVQPGGGRILACLQSREAELTPQCRDVMPKAEALKTKASNAGVLPR